MRQAVLWLVRHGIPSLTDRRRLRAQCTGGAGKVAEAVGVSQQRISANESGAVAELATLGDYIRALGGELKVITASS
jgi:DNA-binding XRE family transcriptional regulator